MKPAGLRRLGAAAAVLLLLAATVSCARPARNLPEGLYAVIDTERGEVVVELDPERAPLTVMSFVGLAEGRIDNDVRPGQPFFDGLTFHRVEPGFVIQGGDPNGDGTGGPGYRFPTETHPELLHDGPGVVAMANSGPDTNGSQFYITLRATPHLDGGYNVFGRVIEGMDSVNAVQQGDRMRSVKIVRVGQAAQAYQASTAAFDALVEEAFAGREFAAELARQESLSVIRQRWPNAEEYGETGLLLVRERPGTGTLPEAGDPMRLHLVFTLLDGTQIDSTRDRNEPYEFNYLVQRLIPGLELAAGTLLAGERTIAFVPPELAFGSAGLPPAVPPNSFVVFEMERLE